MSIAQDDLLSAYEPVFAAGSSDTDTTIPQVDGVVEAARRRLLGQSHLAIQRIWCEFCDGSLFLRGHVPSFYHKQLAQTAVAGLKGVEQVVNEIDVVW
jgi:osmotically-inducible protein OsmY